MLLPDHSYVKAQTLEECLRLMSEHGERAMVVAGGTDVIFNMRLKLFAPDTALSIRQIPELQAVETLDDGSLRIGAGARLADLLERDDINERWPAFADSIRAVASTHIRNMATLGGNICLHTRCSYTNNSEEWRKGLKDCYKTDGQLCHVIKSSDTCLAINNSDTPVALIMHGATLTLQSAAGTREVPIAGFYTPDGHHNTILEPGELVTRVTVPPTDDRTVFMKLAPRKGMDFSTAAVAARADGSGDGPANVTIVLGSVSSQPIVLDKPARIVSERGLGDGRDRRGRRPGARRTRRRHEPVQPGRPTRNRWPACWSGARSSHSGRVENGQAHDEPDRERRYLRSRRQRQPDAAGRHPRQRRPQGHEARLHDRRLRRLLHQQRGGRSGPVVHHACARMGRRIDHDDRRPRAERRTRRDPESLHRIRCRAVRFLHAGRHHVGESDRQPVSAAEPKSR